MIISSPPPAQGTPLPEIQRLIYQTLGTLDREEFPPDETSPPSAHGQPPADASNAAGDKKDKAPIAVKQDVEIGAWESLVGGVWAAMGASLPIIVGCCPSVLIPATPNRRGPSSTCEGRLAPWLVAAEAAARRRASARRRPGRAILGRAVEIPSCAPLLISTEPIVLPS